MSANDAGERGRAREQRRRGRGTPGSTSEDELQHQRFEQLKFAGGIAHDFNNLLVGIVGSADLALADLPSGSPVREHLRVIALAAEECTDLTNEVLAYAGQGSFLPEDIDLQSLLENMSRLLENSISENVSLKVDIPPGLSSIVGDCLQVRRLIRNLMTNASEAIGKETGSITITAHEGRCRDNCQCRILGGGDPWPEGSSRVTLEISDTGCGIDEATREQIFEPFFTTKSVGRGMGLAAVHGILREHNAGLEVESTRGEGTTFRLNFTTVDQPHVPEEITKRDEEWTGSGTILLVDDERLVRDVGAKLLERLGFTVITATDGEHALEVFREHSEDITLVVLDLVMPKMNGKEAFGALRQLRADLPIVLCSGYAGESALQDFAGKGVSGFVQKPFTTAQLRSRLRTVLETAKRPGSD